MPREPGERTRREQEALPITQTRSGRAERAEEQELETQRGVCTIEKHEDREQEEGSG